MKKKEAKIVGKSAKGNGRKSIDSIVDNICDIMRRGNMTGAMQYVPELSWLLFLRIFDEKEIRNEKNQKALALKPEPAALEAPYRWRDWAAKDGEYRKRLAEKSGEALLGFVNDKLLPHLAGLRNKQNATLKQRVISQMFVDGQKTRMQTQRVLLDVLDRVDALRQEDIDDTHTFLLSQVYENLLLKMGEKNNDGGQFFTPREVVRAMTQVVDPKVGETIYDPCCGTGGFLAQANEYMRQSKGKDLHAREKKFLREKTFYGREKENMIYPIALANLVLHDIDVPHIWHGNALNKHETDGSLMTNDEQHMRFDVVLTNPPFGGKEAADVQRYFDYPTSSTQTLFVQEIMRTLKKGGRCGMVIDEGFMFQTNEAIVNVKRRLLEKFNLWCVVSLPAGVFSQTGAGVKTNLMFFNNKGETGEVWYYDLSHVHVTKKQPLTKAHFEEFFKLLPKRKEGENSWRVSAEAIAANGYNLRAINPNKKVETDTRTPAQLAKIIRDQNKKIDAALSALTALTPNETP